MVEKDEIYAWFVNSNLSGCCYVDGMPEHVAAYYCRDGSFYGVMIPLESECVEIDERFSNIRLYSAYMEGDVEGNFLKLMCKLSGESFSDKFAALCCDFIEPGKDGSKRRAITADPFGWWSEWKSLMGNREGRIEAYAAMGELLTLCHLIDIGQNPVWEGPDAGTIDVRGEDFDCEVKSTLVRDEKRITVSSVHQMNDGDRELHLYYCCFERSSAGMTLDDVVDALARRGADIDSIEDRLDGLELSRGTAARKGRFTLLSMQDYRVDENFPRITDGSFTEGHLPRGVESITYVVSLAGLESETVHLEL